MRTLLVLLLSVVGVATWAETYADLKSALSSTFVGSTKVLKFDTRLTSTQAADINRRWGGGFQPGDRLTWYYAKDAQGRVAKAAVEMTEVLDKYSAYHRWVVAFAADRSLLSLTVLELTNDHTYGMAQASFQRQFAGKDPSTLRLGGGVDAVTGATESSQLLMDSLHRARYLLETTVLP